MLIECRLDRLISDIAVVSLIQSRSKQVFVVVVSNNFASCAEAFNGAYASLQFFYIVLLKQKGRLKRNHITTR